MSDKNLSIVIPYRNREEHMAIFVPHMEKFLYDRGILRFRIRLIEQAATQEEQPFNRAKLLNVGFDIDKDWADYFCFHDVDMIPTEADYSYVNEPTHMATECSQFGYQLPYGGYFGGVTMFNKQDFMEVNGYSNLYWGWGAEDDDMMLRCYAKGKIIPPAHIPRRRGRYESLAHKRTVWLNEYKENINRLRGLTEENVIVEGLNTLTYTEVARGVIPESRHTTKIKVSI
jgi:hypothetical protein